MFATFEVLEAGGVQVSDVMGVDEKDRLEVFKVDTFGNFSLTYQ